MKFKIGFTAEKEVEKKAPETETKAPEEAPARESLVRVYFPQRGFDCTYYNNLFDLHVGDLVYVDGKLEGKRGKVIDVSYTFKIKLSDYKRVIAKIDTDIFGEFCYVGDELFSLDKNTVPFGKILPYFKAPAKPDEEYLDAMLTVYYRAYLRAANAADPAELRYVTELHSQSLSDGIKSGATGAVTFTLDKSDMVCDTEHIAYGDNTVTVNAAASYEAVNDTTGEVETATDYYTIQAVWQDGMWLVDRSWMISESDYQNGVFGNQ